ncbi:MAG: hypothetical protein PHD04_00930 [Candidatus Pacebacteria bacterium]|nr:hypothetical protein [Candidatus Paceibacterota bacterium]
MKLKIYEEIIEKYYGGESGYEYQPVTEIEVNGNPDARREWCVVEYPWEEDPRVISWHQSLSAAVKAAQRHGVDFGAQNRGGYGWAWKPGRCKP